MLVCSNKSGAITSILEADSGKKLSYLAILIFLPLKETTKYAPWQEYHLITVLHISDKMMPEK